MPFQQMPKFKSVPDKMYEIPQPGIGGLNLKDLEFEQETSQSPYMKNVMYRNGAFAKRYGQALMQSASGDLEFSGEVYSIICFDDMIFVHAGGKVYTYTENTSPVTLSGTLPETRGQFIVYAQKLYYLVSTAGEEPDLSGLYEFKKENNVYTFEPITAYVPETLLNCRPSSSDAHADPYETINILSNQVTHVYNGDGTTTVYNTYEQDNINYDIAPIVKKDDVVITTGFSYDSSTKKVTFTTAPESGDMNVEFTWTLKNSVNATERTDIYKCKFHEAFGGTNSSCLFVAGCGGSKYYYSNAYDIAYFPATNYGTVGNTEDDITGFGRQYNVLIVFKPRETFSISSYLLDSTNSMSPEEYGMEGFRSQIVNPRIGCDCPYSIQLINNLLTWFNTREGICTLVSTNIQDERNIRVLSRNIERTNNFGIKGILDYDEDPMKIQSTDFESRYFLVFPESGYCFMWDYEISPYRFTSNGETPPSKLAWFMFDHFYVKEFLKVGKELIYSSNYRYEYTIEEETYSIDYRKNLVKLDMSFNDLNYKNEGHAIDSYYMTPFLQYGAVESLKNVKNIFVQCRGDTATKIDMWYYDESSFEGEQEPESILIGGRLWKHFSWETFAWFTIGWASTFRRKCNLKKIQMASFLFKNNEPGRDLSITHIGMQYQVVKYIR